jgi:hypothetical protein
MYASRRATPRIGMKCMEQDSHVSSGGVVGHVECGSQLRLSIALEHVGIGVEVVEDG